MELSGLTLLSLVVPLIGIEGFFSGSEIALLSADRLKLRVLEKKGSVGAQLALKLVEHPELIFSTTVVMTSFCVVLISALFSLYFATTRFSESQIIPIVVTSGIIVLFGELIPKSFYQRHADKIAHHVSYPLFVSFYALYPVSRIISLYTSRLSRLTGPIEQLITGKKRTSRDELKTILSYSKRESEIKTAEKRMIKRILDFKETDAEHALIPLIRVNAIEDVSTVREALEEFQQHRHSRMPVYQGRVDNIVGVVEVTDLLTEGNMTLPIGQFVKGVSFAAESQAVEDVLHEMVRKSQKVTVVVDEYGGAVGIITLEDILEEVVGEIQDEYDPDTSAIKELSVTSWLIQGSMEIQPLNENLKLEIPEGDYETLSGFLLQQFGRIPEVKDELLFTTPAGDLRFSIRQASEKRIEQVLLEKLETSSGM